MDGKRVLLPLGLAMLQPAPLRLESAFLTENLRPTTPTAKQEAAMRVWNINMRGEWTCACGSWLRHWWVYGRRPVAAILCSKKYCMEPANYGALAQRNETGDENWYVIPVCYRHNGTARGMHGDP